ncbi:MAG: tetratricopeptide repeat protein [Bacteroidetes bacterium]|nr:tetratricopeptide repeat protein [Bacteroidota bacterium]
MRIITLSILIFLLLAGFASAQLKGIPSYDNAYRNYVAGNFDEAIKNYDDYIKSYPNDDKAIYERGMCYESQRKFDDALRNYNAALQLKPYFSPYYVSRGYAFVKTNMPQNAYDDFTRAVQNDPTNPDGYFGRVNANLDLNKYDFALTDLNAAINLNNKNPLYYYVRAMIYTELDDTTRFYNDIERILSNYPGEYFSSFKSQGVVLILDNIENNINYLNDAITNDPENYLLYFKRGFNYYLFRRFVPAADDFQKAARLSPDSQSRLVKYAGMLIDNCKFYSEK